ncbi:MAG: CcmD family protein [SAR202 cluster bacterium]|nr:CcmD family protein [SAR202 cluster bacterium]
MSFTGPLRFAPKPHVLAILVVAPVVIHALLAATPLLAASSDSGHGAVQTVAQQAADDREPEANLAYLFAVFIITWAVLFGYVFYLSRRQRAMQREIEALRAALAEKERPFAAAPERKT